jgi:hypothetical protein
LISQGTAQQPVKCPGANCSESAGTKNNFRSGSAVEICSWIVAENDAASSDVSVSSASWMIELSCDWVLLSHKSTPHMNVSFWFMWFGSKYWITRSSKPLDRNSGKSPTQTNFRTSQYQHFHIFEPNDPEIFLYSCHHK